MSMSPRREIGTTLFRNTIIVTIGGVLLRILNAAFTLYAVRWLGESEYGRYTQVVALVGLFGIFFELGMSQYVQRNIAQDQSQASSLIGNLIALRLILAVLGCGVITLIAIALRYEQPLVFGVFLQTSTFVFAALLVPIAIILTAHERFGIPTVVGVLGQLLNVTLGLTFLWLGYGFLALLCAGIAVMPVRMLLTVIGFWKSGLSMPRLKITPAEWPSFIKASFPFGLTSFALAYNFGADAVILGYFRSDAEVGWYGAAYRLVFTLTSLVGGFLVVLTPTLAREHVVDPKRVARVVRISLSWLALFSLPAAMGVSMLAGPITLLLYGESFAPAEPVLALICWDLPLLMFTAFCGNLSAAINRERDMARIYLMSAGANVVLNVLLIPTYGMYAAAAITVTTDAITSARFFVLFNRHLDIGQVLPRLLRTGIAAVLMGVVVIQTREFGLPAAVVAGTLSFGILAIVLKAVDLNELPPRFQRLVRRA